MIDNHGRKISYLRLSVTERCNLRCRYCMPEEGICKKNHADMLTEDEMIMAAEAAASIGVSKIRITGGEPLLKKNILSICRRTAAVEGIKELCLTTNGTLLADMAEDLKAAGVNRINISLDTLNPEKFGHMTCRPGMYEKAEAGLKKALETGFEKIKINTVLIGGYNDDEIRDLAELTLKYPVDVRFIELMPMYDSGDFGQDAYLSGDAVLAALPELTECGGGNEGNSEGVAKLYSLPGALGRIGIISPVSNHFCSSCNRLRLTADGFIKPCLHGAGELHIKGLDYEAMKEQFEKAVLMKPACHEPLSAEERSEAGRNMNQIGG